MYMLRLTDRLDDRGRWIYLTSLGTTSHYWEAKHYPTKEDALLNAKENQGAVELINT